jgi:hypothetical protein
MEFIRENWFFILFAILFVGMHLFGFGCGGHGKHGKHGREDGHDEPGQSGEGSSVKKGGSSCH